MKKYALFLDTNIYDAANYSFGNPQFDKVKQLTDDGNVLLLINSVIEGEVNSHISKRITDAVRVVNKALKDRVFSALRYDEIYQNRVQAFDIEDIKQHVESDFCTYLENCGVQRITTNNIDVEQVISDYFTGNPPFEEKKPDEFKDALAVKSILKYCAEHIEDTILCVVSKDKGFIKAFENKPVLTFHDLNVFLSMMTTVLDTRVLKLKSFIDAGNADDEIEEGLKAEIEGIQFSSIELPDEFEISEINDIEYKLLYIHSMDPSTAIIEVEVQAIVKAWSNTVDEDQSYFDKEDWQYLWKVEIEKEETHQISFEAEITLDISGFADHPVEEDEPDFSDDVVIVREIGGIPENFILDEDTCIDIEILSETDPFHDDEDGRDVAFDICPDCGSPIGIGNDGGNGFCINCAMKH